DRATVANMAPEYGATVGFFPIDAVTLAYLRLTNREPRRIALVEAYAKAQGLWYESGAPAPRFTNVLDFDLTSVRPSMAGPRRPQDRVELAEASDSFRSELARIRGNTALRQAKLPDGSAMGDGSVIIAAITSCTNTSNPSVMIAAGLLARKARERGLQRKPWVKASLTPGSRVVAAYLEASGLQADLDALGFAVAGFGCATCPGLSGPLDDDVTAAIDSSGITGVAVLSGNRNFEGRIHPNAEANYLASPPLVVAYALSGSMQDDLLKVGLGNDRDGKPVMLHEVWPDNAEVQAVMDATLSRALFESRYADLLQGSAEWQNLSAQHGSARFAWDPGSSYIKRPPYFDGVTATPPPVRDIENARILAVLGDSVTTDHISPGGSIRAASPAGEYLREFQIRPADFNSYLARRGNHEVMMRGTFAHPRLWNALAPQAQGGKTRHCPTGEVTSIYEAAMRYAADGLPLVVFGGRDYGNGSSRDWAAKGPALLGVKAVIAESFERIHRTNLVCMGILPLVRPAGALALSGEETVSIAGLESLTPRGTLVLALRRSDASTEMIPVTCRIDTDDELEYWRHGGVLQYLLRAMLTA
ncbi:MAG: aconitate hydratase AcnA, partial [Alphaproteobacteria bacterium]|nr:aconitate hydratase AcnA [Alphaproteobacteria bacterium]